ncbi:MAG: hypothetical protein ACKVOM_01615 [Ferruginibacter sp.]
MAKMRLVFAPTANGKFIFNSLFKKLNGEDNSGFASIWDIENLNNNLFLRTSSY